LAYAMLIPDPSIVWARRAMSHPVVRHAVRTSSLLMSSSPPEAAFIACAKLARRYGIPFWMDMRDGWLDEPLKPLLRTSAIQRWRERRLEAFCLSTAAAVTVTSDQWASMLAARYPQHASKIRVVTNAAPESVGRTLPPSESISLCYAGRLTSSRPERDVNDLAMALKLLKPHRFTVIGSLTADEHEEVTKRGWTIRHEQPREALLQTLASESGLVLLSASKGSIPAKFFDYLATGRPILGIAPRESAAWEAMSKAPQAFAVDLEEPMSPAFSEFIQGTAQTEPAPVPRDFTEEAVKIRFMEVLSCL
jgi:hypothetical protein